MNFVTRETSEYAKARGKADGLNCCMCGWPFKATSSVMTAGRDASGERQYKHGMCPSLSERKRLRAEALVQS